MAGAGAFWCINSSLNLSLPLPGTRQTNQRAELYAVLKVLETEGRPVQICTDSAYVFNGCTVNRFKWKSNGWKNKRRVISNCDLWQSVDKALRSRRP
eukprot:6658297-Karenia_brevis.AAC.1